MQHLWSFFKHLPFFEQAARPGLRWAFGFPAYESR